MAIDNDSTVVIVGASLAGLRAAETLRSEGFGGRVVLIGSETYLPYDRPPLSKQFLAGTWGLDRVRLRDEDKLDALGLDLRLGCTVTGLDIEGHAVQLDGEDEPLGYDGLVIATGSRPRTLGGTEGVSGIHTLRTLDDSMAIASATATEGTRLVVVGAGFIGSEVAATCQGRGVDVTVVEALAVPLAGVLGLEMGAACAELHARNGVAVRTGTSVVDVVTEVPVPGPSASTPSATTPASKVVGLELSDGAIVHADVVVIGVGVTPAVDWLADSGLELSNGVKCDATLYAADDVVAAGDVAHWFEARQQRHVRIEHWTNAAEQGVVAARNLLAGRGNATPYEPVPYFWSDQYDIKIQMIGYPYPDDDVVVVDGSPSSGRFVALYGRQGRLTAALGFGRPRQLMAYRPLLEAGSTLDEGRALAT